MTESKSIVKNTFYLTLSYVGQKALSFVYFTVIARMVGDEWTGKYFVALAYMMIFSVLIDFGLTPVLIREIAKDRDKAKMYIGAVLAVKMIFAILTIILAASILQFLGYDPMTKNLIYLAFLIMILDTVHLTLYGIFRGYHNLAVEAKGIFVGQILTISIGLVSLIVDPRLEWLVLALVVGSLYNVAYSYSKITRGLKLSLKPIWNSVILKKLLWLALPFALAAIFVKVYSYIDSLFLKHFIGDQAVGWYSVAYKMTYAFQFLPLAFTASLYPAMSSLFVSDRQKLAEVFEKSLWYVLVLAAPIVFGLWSLADKIIPAFFGPEFVNSILPLQILIFVLIFIFLDFPVGSLLNAVNKQTVKTTIMGITMVINIVFNAALIPIYGVNGACIAALASFSFLFISGFVYSKRIVNYRLGRVINSLAPILVSGLVMALVVVALKGYLSFIFLVPVGAGVYVFMLLLTRSITLAQIKDFPSLIKRS